MARQTRRTRPGDVANAFIRNFLAEASKTLGGFTEEEWEKTLAYFDHCCAYTGEPLRGSNLNRDHAIPINKDHGGLHLYGNVLPTTSEVNARKRSLHYRLFVTEPEELVRIERFIEASGYHSRAARLGDLRAYCVEQYRVINDLCAQNHDYLRRLQQGSQADPTNLSAPMPPSAPTIQPLNALPVRTLAHVREGVLPIELDPAPEAVFKRLLLHQRGAWITVYYAEGRSEVIFWNASNFQAGSSVMGNLRSRPQFRRQASKMLGIVRVVVSIERPTP